MQRLFFSFGAGFLLASAIYFLLPERQSRPSRSSNTAIVTTTPKSNSEISLEEAQQSNSSELKATSESDSSESASARLGNTALPSELTRLRESSLSVSARRDLMENWSENELRDLYATAEDVLKPSQQMLDAQYVQALVRAELMDREFLARMSDEGPPELPIKLPAEFDYLSDMSERQHELIQREPIDATWSAPMESNLADFFASNPDLTNTLGYPTINCRLTSCEVAISTYALDDETGSSELERYIRIMMEQVREQPWAEQLDGSLSYSRPRLQDSGAFTVFWYLARENETLAY